MPEDRRKAIDDKNHASVKFNRNPQPSGNDLLNKQHSLYVVMNVRWSLQINMGSLQTGYNKLYPILSLT